MKRALFLIGALDVLWVVVSLLGILFDPARLSLWTQHLMLGLLAALVLAPLMVFVNAGRPDATTKPPATVEPNPTRPPPADQPSPPPSVPRRPTAPSAPLSLAQKVIWGTGAVLALSAITSLVALLLGETNQLWTQVLLWSLLGALVWAPVFALWPGSQRPKALRPQPAEAAANEPPPFIAPRFQQDVERTSAPVVWDDEEWDPNWPPDPAAPDSLPSKTEGTTKNTRASSDDPSKSNQSGSDYSAGHPPHLSWPNE